jgi:septal ring factor EnvC (AmiA/AmiB activator)
MLTREAFMTTSTTPEDTIAECKRRASQCYALLESAIVPEYRQALSAMAAAWMKIAQSEETIQEKSATTPNCLQVSSKSNRKLSRRI